MARISSIASIAGHVCFAERTFNDSDFHPVAIRWKPGYHFRHSIIPAIQIPECRMITVSAQAIGRRKPLCDDFTISPPKVPGDRTTLRELIGHVVRSEVDAFKTRQTERRLLKTLTAKEIDAGLATGKVTAGGSDLDQKVDPEEAVATAIEAFADGLFLVVVDDEEVKELDASVALTENSKLTFVRLTMLAGG